MHVKIILDFTQSRGLHEEEKQPEEVLSVTIFPFELIT